jgi:hypothetical protein
MATNLQFIKSASGSSVSSLSVTDCFSSEYDVYYINLTNLDQSSSGVQTQVRYLNSSGSQISTTDYNWAQLVMRSSSSFAEGKVTSDTEQEGISYQVTTTSGGIGVSMYVYNPFDSSSFTFSTTQTSFIYSGNLEGYKAIQVLKSAESVTGISFNNVSPHTYDNIKANVYGVK